MSYDEVRTETEYRDRIEGLEQRIMDLEFDLEKKEQENEELRTDLATERSQRASILGEIEDIAQSINALMRNN